MAAQNPRPGAGTILEVEDSQTPGTWLTVGCVYAITPPGVSYEQVESELCLSDTTSTTGQSAPGDPEVDEIAFEGAFDRGSDEDARLQAIADGRTTENWRITYPGATMADTFLGYLRQYKPQSVTRREYMRTDGIIVRTGAFTSAVPAP